MTVIEQLRDIRTWLSWSALVGMLSGGLLALPLVMYADDATNAFEDWWRPVVRARVHTVASHNNEVTFRLAITRLRGDCHLVGAYAYAITPERFALRANAARVDGDSPHNLPVGIEIDIGAWRAWPVGGAKTMVLYVHHACNGRLVSTKLAEIPT